jgi:hypothetical protein
LKLPEHRGDFLKFLVEMSALFQFRSVQFSSVQFSSVQFGSVRFGSVRFSSVAEELSFPRAAVPQGALDAVTVCSLGLAGADLRVVEGWVAQHKLHTCAQFGCGAAFTLAGIGAANSVAADAGPEGERHRPRQCVHCKRPFR